MNIVAIKSLDADEKRVALTPATVQKLMRLGATVTIQSGLGEHLGFGDADYEAAGATLSATANEALKQADMLVMVEKPEPAFFESLKAGTRFIGFIDPYRDPGLVNALKDARITSYCMELIPRTTYAQKMDALSSQASLAGYEAVMIAAERISKAFPMMSTPAGTIPPAKVFVIGVGVAGLQAIATAKRLGARVEAYDTRPVVEEQVQSLGAKFVKIDVGETGQTEQGYAKALTEEQLELQRQQMAKFCANADVVITTAQLFGRPAPRIVTADMVAGMRSGSVIVDLAASTGGNVEGSVSGQEVIKDGVRIIGMSNLAAHVAKDASQMYSSNVYNLIEHLWDKESGGVAPDLDDEIHNSVLLTRDGVICHTGVREFVEGLA